ncbi:Phosphomevalonate kinase [Auriscalpium vulgare]|uniref:Phosphomevalonate kinase n=1 Tax=Auriscalpium vulgare TaxID=40419 RepID=A0ACB8S400_9AGAM|nr:Phosphomevalonate kinase [Auriscalpium vulgare]
MSSIVVSSPGKVLLAGGYLVLDPAYSGVVVSTSSRFYTVIQPAGAAPAQITVRSPQFLDATWSYTCNVDDRAQPPTVVVSQVESPASASKNKFVHLALQKTLSLALEDKGAATLSQSLAQGLTITIAGDNDFYSQQDQLAKLGLPSELASLSKIPPFASTGVHLPDVSKTGLGSSAALITSLVTALLVHTGVIAPAALAGGEVTLAHRFAHNLAQFVHCLAQGKVGSGFDVAAAVFGSQLYTRFNPAVIQHLMDDTSGTQPLLPTISPGNAAWDYQVKPFKLPPHTRILLADIHAGSNTPLLVGQVLKWRKENPAEAHSLWTSLDQVNTSLGQTLTRLSELHSQNPDAYLETVRYISSLTSVQWLANPNMQQHHAHCLEAFYEAHLLTEQIRTKMREMGGLSGVEIEPAQQTKLLDESVALAGVIGGGVPGAGGFDAVWLLVAEPPLPIYGIPPVQLIERLWSEYKGVSPLLSTESRAQGVILEDLDAIPGLKDAVSASA